MANLVTPAVPTPQSTEVIADQLVETFIEGQTTFTVQTQNICFAAVHKHFSLEELRLNDYAHNRGKIRRPPVDFEGSPSGLLHAFIPQQTPVQNARKQVRQPKYMAPTDFTSAIVFFQVGSKDTEQFDVHENLIAPRSEFVRLALSRDWKEAHERTISLPEEDPAAFSLYQSCIYHQRIYSGGHRCSAPDATEYTLLVKAYLLGEKLADNHFKDATTDCILAQLHTDNLFDGRLTNLVYNGTPQTSPLRLLLQDIYIWCGNSAWLEVADANGEAVNMDFVLDLGKRQLGFWGGQRPQQAPFQEESCLYHQHVDGVCYKMSTL